MDEREERRQQLLAELARRFHDSAKNLKQVARRINDAASTHQRVTERMTQAGQGLREHVDASRSIVPFTFLEYLEFSSAEEFQKFRVEPTITSADIMAVDWDGLTTRLQADKDEE